MGMGAGAETAPQKKVTIYLSVNDIFLCISHLPGRV